MTLHRCFILLLTLLLSPMLLASALNAEPGAEPEAVPSTPPLLTLNNPGDYSTGLHSLWLEDPAAELDASTAMAASGWQLSDRDSLNFGFSNSVFWLQLPLQNLTSQPDWALWIHYSLLDLTEAWLCPQPVTGISQCHYQQSGDLQPFSSNRAIDHPNTILPLLLQPQQSYVLLLRIKTQGTFQIPANLMDADTLQDKLLTSNLLRGGYYATMIVMGLYNLFIFFSTRERSYLYYSGFVLSFLLFHMVYEGSAFQFFWPDVPRINEFALPIFFALNMLIMSLFVPNFLALKQHSAGAFRLFRVYSALILVSVLMLPLLHYQAMVQIHNLLSITLTASALMVGIRFWARGHAAARYFTIAWAVLITGLILANSRSLGLIPTNVFTLYAYQIGSFMEVILLSLALGERIMQLQKDQLKARQELMQSQEDAIQYLRDYEDLYQNSLTGKFQLDGEGYFSKTNPAWRTMLGYTEQRYFNADNPRFNSLFTDAEERKAFWKKLKENGRVQAYVVSMTQPVTEERIMVSLTMRKGSNAENAAWFGSGQDVTEDYLKEQALIQLQKEKTQSLRQLVMGIAHEMNTPLGNIRMAETFLNDNNQHWTLDEQQQHLRQGLEFIHNGTERLNELNQLMKSAVVQENQYAGELLLLRPWLQNWQLEHQKQDEKLQLRTAVHSYLVDWPTYPEALQIILDQLLENSCIHNQELHEAGKLKVSVEFRERGDYLELHYRDNGKGVDKDQRDAIFMPFYTTRRTVARHKGLGLYQTYNLLTELLHGHVEWLDTEEAGFALMVRFNLPLPERNTPAEPQPVTDLVEQITNDKDKNDNGHGE